LIGNEEDFTASLGFEVDALDDDHSALDPKHFGKMTRKVAQEFPNLSVVAVTLRHAKTATITDWGAICSCAVTRFDPAMRQELESYDRVRGGDSFVCGPVDG